MSDEPDKDLLLHARRDEEMCIDGQKHDFKGWVEIDGGLGGTTVCTKCQMTAFEHSMRYSE